MGFQNFAPSWLLEKGSECFENLSMNGNLSILSNLFPFVTSASSVQALSPAEGLRENLANHSFLYLLSFAIQSAVHAFLLQLPHNALVHEILGLGRAGLRTLTRAQYFGNSLFPLVRHLH